MPVLTVASQDNLEEGSVPEPKSVGLHYVMRPPTHMTTPWHNSTARFQYADSPLDAFLSVSTASRSA